jgi:tRNA threonylcarbamoyladenosine biosynthesis protein TsaB
VINLFIDTANTDLVIAITDQDKILYLYDEANDTNLSIKLVPELKKALDDVNLKPKDINNIYIVDGPGSFTGTRMGVTVAKTWAWALKKKVIPISELEVMATTKVDTDYIMPMIDARHEHVYAGLFDREGKVIIEGQYISVNEMLSKLPINKTITIVSNEEFDLGYECIKAVKNIMMIIKRHESDVGVNPHNLNPNYLKKTEAEENLRK